MRVEQLISQGAAAVLDSLLLLIFSSGPMFFLVVKPILNQSRSYQYSLERITDALENSGDSVIIMDAYGYISYVNKAFESMTAYSIKEVVGHSFQMLLPKQDRAALTRMISRSLIETSQWKGEIQSKHKNGSLIPQYMHLKYISNVAGSDPYCIINARDISEAKHQESLLRQAQKMEAIGTLVGGVAHNFNNLLAGIIGKTYLAKKHTNHHKLLSHLNDIESLSYDANMIIKQLLTFSHDNTQNMQVMNIVPLIKNAVDTAKLGVKEDITIITDFNTPSHTVYCDSTEITQVILNLVNNARDAMSTGTREIKISIKPDVSQGQSGVHQKHGTEFVGLVVEDSGSGIDDNTLKYIFDPFYTTKEVGKGTGLGLSSVKGTIELHGGFIHVSSKLGIGTKFEIYLPRVYSPVSDTHIEMEVTPAQNRATVLIVDDDEMLRTTLSQLLDDLGYKTIKAKNAKKALEKFHQNINEIDLIISDIVMPLMNGTTLITNIREIKPHTPVLFLTGSNGYESLVDSSIDTPTELIKKPFDIPILSLKIHKLINSKYK
ncbi:MAG: ATP-binding protein [Mariprofundaceae bacterium]